MTHKKENKTCFKFNKMQFTSTIENFTDDPIWGTHFPIPTEIAEKFKENDRRVLLSINNLPEIHCALMPSGNGTWFINATKELRKKLQLNIGDQVTLQIRVDDSKYGMALPEELAELFQIEEEGNRVFHTLTLGKQRALLYQIGKPKNTGTRLKKALMIIDYLKSVNGNLDFKELNVFMKERKGEY